MDFISMEKVGQCIMYNDRKIFLWILLSIPVTNKSPFLNIQRVHANIKKNKNLRNKRQGCKGMPAAEAMRSTIKPCQVPKV